MFFDLSYNENLLVLYYSNEEIVVYQIESKKILSQFKSIAQLYQIKITPDETKVIGSL